MVVEDEIWRPGYDGPAPVSGDTIYDRDASSGHERRVRRRRLWRLASAVIAAGATALAATLVAGPLPVRPDAQGALDVTPPIEVIDEDRLQFSSSEDVDFTADEPLRLLDDPSTPFAGADPRRLPSELSTRWSTELAPLVADGGANATTWVHAVDSRYVIVGIGDARSLTGPAAVHVLDAATGDRLWVTQVESRIDQVEFVAAIDDSLVVTIGSEIVALDLGSGLQLWSDRLTRVDGSLEQVRHLEGTDLLARSSPDPTGPIRLVEPSTGAVAGQLVGQVLGPDRQGRWSVLRGGKILGFDLAPRPNGGSEPVGEAKLLGAVDAERSRDVAIVGDWLVATVDEMLAFGPLELNGERATGPGGLTPLTTELDTPDVMVLVRGFVPLGGSAFAIIGSGMVQGAEIRDGTIRFAWQRRGTVTASFSTERGVVLLVGTDGGSAQTLVDGATGETIAPLTMSPDLFDVLEVAGNGVVARRTSQDGLRIAGLDLDGNEMWALDGSAPVSVGDRTVVRSISQPDGSFEVAAYGDPG